MADRPDSREFWRQVGAMREMAGTFAQLARQHREEIRALKNAEVANRLEMDILNGRLADLTKDRDHWRERHRRLEQKLEEGAAPE